MHLDGYGSYFAENSNKSDQYAGFSHDDHGKQEFCIILARVCLGSHPHTQHYKSKDASEFKMPPSIDGRTDGSRHTSVIGTAGHHREFIVYDGMQAYDSLAVPTPFQLCPRQHQPHHARLVNVMIL